MVTHVLEGLDIVCWPFPIGPLFYWLNLPLVPTGEKEFNSRHFSQNVCTEVAQSYQEPSIWRETPCGNNSPEQPHNFTTNVFRMYGSLTSHQRKEFVKMGTKVDQAGANAWCSRSFFSINWIILIVQYVKRADIMSKSTCDTPALNFIEHNKVKMLFTSRI